MVVKNAVKGGDRITNGVGEFRLRKIFNQLRCRQVIPHVLRVNDQGMGTGRPPAERQIVRNVYEKKKGPARL